MYQILHRPVLRPIAASMATEKLGPDHFDDVNGVSSDDNAEGVTWSDAEEKTVRNKLDWQIVPMVTLLYLLCFLDR